jgi:acetylornithine aminotransferase
MDDNILKCHDLIKINFIRGDNCYLYDDQGKRYTDFEAGCWSTALGYNHPRIHQAMKDQIDQVIHLGTRYPNAVTTEAAQAVLSLVGMEGGKCVFLSSGSEAVEFAARITRVVTAKPWLLTFTNSYLSALGSAGKKSDTEWKLFDWSACTQADGGACLRDLPLEQIGGFVFEPGGSGSESVRFPSKSLVQEIAAQIGQVDGLLVANEITTGMGRTGKWFGYQHYDIQPDIVAMGKCIGNGYPVSVVAMKRTVADKLEAGGFYYAQSHQNDPLGCRVAKEVIAILRAENWIEKGNATGAYFLKGLQHLAEKHANVKEARGRGMLLALELNPHQGFSTATVFQALLEKGFLVTHKPDRNFLRFDPALTMQKEDVDSLLECLDDILEVHP